METITYKRPSGTTITVNATPETRAFAASAGWVEVKPESEKPARKGKAK